MKVKSIKKITRTVEEEGIVLPWEKVELQGPVEIRGVMHYTERPPKGTVLETGEVFITMHTLYELSEQDTWDSEFGKAFLLGYHEGLALEQAGLAIRETRGGYHRSKKLMKLIEQLEG